MGFEKRTVQWGNGVDFPQKGDTVTMEYTGWIYDPTKPENKGGEKP
jgi:FK506-binding protein 1